MKPYLCFLSCIWHLFKEASHCGEILHSLQTTKEHRYKEGSTNRRAKGPGVWFLKWLLYPVGHREMFTKKQLNQSRNAHFCDILGGFMPGNRKAGMGPETTTCLDNHPRELSEVCKLSLRPNAQSAADHQVPRAGSGLITWGWQKLPPAPPCPSHTLGWPGPAPALPTSEWEHSPISWFRPASCELKASSQAIFSWLC